MSTFPVVGPLSDRFRASSGIWINICFSARLGKAGNSSTESRSYFGIGLTVCGPNKMQSGPASIGPYTTGLIKKMRQQAVYYDELFL